MIELAGRTPVYLNGAFCAGEGERFTVFNPSTEEAVATIAGASPSQVEAMIAAARRAQISWGELSARERARILQGFATALGNYRADLREVLMAEAGVLGGPLPAPAGIMAFQTEAPLRHAQEILDLYLSLPEVTDNPVPLRDRVSPMGKMVDSVMRYSPIGVVAGIASYNFPFMTAIWKVMPALVTGNAVILRPSPLTPISALIFALAGEDAGLPPGVLNVLVEGGVDGARILTTRAGVDMVAFTGSTHVGKQVMAQAAGTMKRVQLELGGKSAQIFLPDAASEAIAQTVGICLSHAGQGCVLGTRVFVPEAAKSEVLAGMKAALENIPIGEVTDPGAMMGPVISAAQVERCEHFVRLAIENRATIVTGGRRPANLSRGHFFQPTVIDAPDNQNPAAREEIFGPVVTVIGYRDVDHAVAMANDSDYGLSGYVYGADRKQALDVAMRLKTGTVNVNGGMLSAWISSGGIKMSGIGRERGVEGIRLYQNVTALNITG